MNRVDQRAALIATRSAINMALRKKWDTQIAEQVLSWCKMHPVNTIGLYNPIQAEPSLYDIFPPLSEIGLTLAFPITPPKKQPLVFHAWKMGEALMKDRYGILVPLETAPIVEPDVIFVPCVGFTTERYRLGYGGGFYDRTLSQTPKPISVGIAYRFCQCELEVMPHDVPLDYIITNY